MYIMNMNRIKQLRTAMGIKQTELCKLLGVTQGSLSGWETGRYEPDIPALVKMSEIFDVSLDYLLGRTDKPAEVQSVDTLHYTPKQQELLTAMEGLTPEQRGLVEQLIRQMSGGDKA